MTRLNKEELSFNRIHQINNNLDLYSRMLCGQYDEMIRPFGYWSFYNNTTINYLLKTLRDFYIPQLAGRGFNTSLGIWDINTPLDATRAFDIQQILRYQISYHLHPEGGYTVNFNKPFIHGKWNLSKYMCQKINDIIIPFQYADYSWLKPNWGCPVAIQSFNDETEVAIVLKSKEVDNIIHKADKYRQLFNEFKVKESFEFLYPRTDYEYTKEIDESLIELERLIKEFYKDKVDYFE